MIDSYLGILYTRRIGYMALEREMQMKELYYEVKIFAPREVVWNKMLDKETYNDWCNAFCEDSQLVQYIGDWEQGGEVKFIDPNMGGTLALLEEVVPYEKTVARHIATLSKDHEEDTTSEMAKKWVGTMETYLFEEENGVTTLKVEIKTHEDFVEMFERGWPVALGNLKRLVEK